MSRIGKSPILLNSNISVEITNRNIGIKGPRGKLDYLLPNEIRVEYKEQQINVYPKTQTKTGKKLHGLARTIINNMVIGVSKGFYKILEIQGVGYRAQMNNQKNLTLNVGYSHPVNIIVPPEVKITVENNTQIKIEGVNKEIVGQIAAEIRSIRPPEPYKCKGIKYQNENIRKKVGKAGK